MIFNRPTTPPTLLVRKFFLSRRLMVRQSFLAWFQEINSLSLFLVISRLIQHFYPSLVFRTFLRLCRFWAEQPHLAGFAAAEPSFAILPSQREPVSVDSMPISSLSIGMAFDLRFTG